MDLGFAGATSVVVGGTRGIGLATALCLAGEGCRVGIIGRDAGQLKETARRLEDAGSPEVLELRADVSSTSEVEAAFQTVGTRWSRLNVLVNTVGPAGAGRLEDLDDHGWTATFDLGVMSAVRCVRSALPLLRNAAWARIVNVTAMSVQHQSPYLVSYTAAKSALLSVTKNLARGLASDGILVNAVAPGPILTDWARPVLSSADVDAGDPVAAFQVLARDHGLSVDIGRLGLPEEVATIIAFCASQRNGYMTGAHLNVDGGSDFL
ncbi:MAG: 3-oxoacyl-[acyl-carrier protein] reductase [Streptosporangiaceae bacterium]|jgi:3-oxoacyl-[acyl-carrier protein] reductase|nr:oxidoreductase, short chain dehydrogenase/reductase family protein [Streptosporangiaceae bacterium]MDX6429319.1 3-oxoacyl-[acyl-carrier protein] reductase [Streptosporangiaceae bacterium]